MTVNRIYPHRRHRSVTRTPEMAMMDPDNLSRLGEAFVRQMNGLGPELARFISERIAEDARFGSRVLTSPDLASLQKAQSDYLRVAVEHYAAETGRLASMGGVILGETFGNSDVGL